MKAKTLPRHPILYSDQYMYAHVRRARNVEEIYFSMDPARRVEAGQTAAARFEECKAVGEMDRNLN